MQKCFTFSFTNIILFIPDDTKHSSTSLSKEVGQRYKAIYPFDAIKSNELSLLCGDVVTVRILLLIK